jgi:YafQ family addiction module toxin component
MTSYAVEVKDGAKAIFLNLQKKNPKQMEIILKKLERITENPQAFKPMRSSMHGLREVHIDKHFVLLFSIDDVTMTVVVHDYGHHEDIFGK